MARNNAGRTGAPTGTEETDELVEDIAPASSNGDSLSFVSPTEFVELPSEGKYYPAGHPLQGQETIEIRYMTAKDEDIITSPALLKRGMAIERLMENLIVDKRVKAHDLLVGDRSAIVMAARVGAYGSDYQTNVTCPRCNSITTATFDLNEVQTYSGDEWGDFDIKETPTGTFIVTLPRSKAQVEIRLTTGRDEKLLQQTQKKKKKYNISEGSTTEVMKLFVVSVNGTTDRASIIKFVENMPAFDARYLRVAHNKVTPKIDTMQDFTCSQCQYETELEVPFTTDFFWPKQ